MVLKIEETTSHATGLLTREVAPPLGFGIDLRAAGIAIRPRTDYRKTSEATYKAGQCLFSIETSAAGMPYIAEWEFRAVRGYKGYLTQKIEGTTFLRGRWLDPIHPDYKLKVSLCAGTRNPIPANFYPDRASAAAKLKGTS